MNDNNRKLVLDYDGTLTNVIAHERPYASGFLHAFSQEVNIPLTRLESIVKLIKPIILADPMKGWEVNGFNVAPANSDPYMKTIAVFQEIGKNIEISDDERQAIFFRCHASGYANCEMQLKPDAERFLESATQARNRGRAFAKVYIITNSDPVSIQKKIDDMSVENIEVLGNAKKFIINPGWQEIPESVQHRGFLRPTLLRRELYSQALKKISTNPTELIVVGDIWEMDLALAEQLGIRTIKINNGCPIDYEDEYMKAKNAYANNLSETAELLGLRLK